MELAANAEPKNGQKFIPLFFRILKFPKVRCVQETGAVVY